MLNITTEKYITESRNNSWYEFNCINDKNIKDIELILINRDIRIYKRVPDAFSTNDDLTIGYMGKMYKVQVSKEKQALILLEQNYANNPKKLEKYHKVEEAGENGCFYEESCWWDLIGWIKNKGKKRKG